MFRFIFGTWIGRLLMFLAAVGAAAWGVRRFLGLGESESDDWTPSPGGATLRRQAPAPPTWMRVCSKSWPVPEDKQPIVKMDDKIVCTNCGKRYPIRDGIPVMLMDEAEEGPVPTEEEVAAARAAVKGEPAVAKRGSPRRLAAAASADCR